HQGAVQQWNPAAEKMFGYPAAEAVGKKIDDLIVPASLRQIYHEGLAEYLITGVGSLLGRPIEMTLRRADASEFRAEAAITAVPNEQPPSYAAVIRDITERKASEEGLRKSEERFRLLVEGVTDYAIYMLDTEGRVAFWNSGAQRLMGYNPEDILGQPLSRVYTPEDCQ